MTPPREFEIAGSPGMAFGVDPARGQRYSLRQARYQALTADIDALAAESGEPLKVLDIGAGLGVLKRYLDAWPNGRDVQLYGADVRVKGIYRREEWAGFWYGDLMGGLPEIPSGHFDVVVCEQVLEHLTELRTPLKTLERLLRPGGTLFVGVPIFPHGAHLIRRHVTPLVDRLIPPGKVRGHVQAFSSRTFLRLLRAETDLDIIAVRGFRIVSGGILRPLEERRGWWRFNRWLGERLPGLCVEVQVVARKRG